MRGDDGAPGADAGEPGGVLVAAGRVHVVAEPGAAGDQPEDGGDREEEEERDGDRSDPVVAEVLEGGGDLARGAGVVVLDPAAQDEGGAEGGDEGVDLEAGDDQPVGQADGGAEGEDGDDRHEDAAALHRLRGDKGAEADEVGDGEVERSGEDDDGLADGHEAQGDTVLKDRHHVGHGQEVPAAGRDGDPAERGDGECGEPDPGHGAGEARAGGARRGGGGRVPRPGRRTVMPLPPWRCRRRWRRA